MYAILVEGNGTGDFDRHSPDGHFDPRGPEQRHEIQIEVGHRARPQREGLHNSVTGLEHKLVMYEVETKFKSPLLIRDPRSRQSPGRYVQRDIPPMVYQGRQTKPNFAHHLRPEMKCCAGIFPRLQRQAGPAFRLIRSGVEHGAGYFFPLSFRKVPSCNSEKACCNCCCVFITIGPYQATGSSSGLPETSRNRMPSSPACTVTSSPRSNKTSERLSASTGGAVSNHLIASVGTASGPDALQNFPPPPKTYANAWRVVSTGKVFRLPGDTETSR